MVFTITVVDAFRNEASYTKLFDLITIQIKDRTKMELENISDSRYLSKKLSGHTNLSTIEVTTFHINRYDPSTSQEEVKSCSKYQGFSYTDFNYSHIYAIR